MGKESLSAPDRSTPLVPGAGASSYVIERSSDGQFFQQVASGAMSALPDGRVYADIGACASAITYSFRVRAVAPGGAESARATTTGRTLPRDPAGLTPRITGFDRIELFWQDNADNEAGFRVESSSDGENWSPVNVAPDATHHVLSGLQPDTAYHFRVLAYSDQGDSLNPATAGPVTIGLPGLSLARVNVFVNDNPEDGYDADQSDAFNDDDASDTSSFVPVTLTLPAWVDLATSMVRLSDGSAPSGGSGGPAWRLWRNNNAIRNVLDLVGLDADYRAADLGVDATTRQVTLYLEQLTPSAAVGDQQIKLSVKPTGAAGEVAGEATTLHTGLRLDLVAHRTGGKFGAAVDPMTEGEGDPTRYLVLTNNDFEEDTGYRDYDDDTAVVDGSDDDLAKITLRGIQPGFVNGTLKLVLSDPTAVRLFKADGTLLSDREVDLFTPAPGSGLAALAATGEQEIWLEALTKNANFSLTLAYEDSGGQTLYQDSVHMLLAEWTFIDAADEELLFVTPTWGEALSAATRREGYGLDTTSEPSRFYKNRKRPANPLLT